MTESILHEKSAMKIDKDVTGVARKIPPLNTAPRLYYVKILQILLLATTPMNVKQISDELESVGT